MLYGNNNNTKMRFIRFAELQEMLGGVSRAKIERDVAAKILPAPFKIGKRTVAFRADEIEEYFKSLPRIPADSYKSHLRKTG